MTGAQFRIEGLPTGWVVLATPTPAANIVLGDLFGAGALMAFPNCITENFVVLYSVIVFPTAPAATAVLRVVPYDPPRPNFDCPLLTCATVLGIRHLPA
jgi:hypothetical protein